MGIALWTHWTHLGTVEGDPSTWQNDILMIDAQKISKVMHKHPDVRTITFEYARQVHARCLATEAGDLREIADPYDGFEEVVSKMEFDARLLISRLALSLLKPIWHMQLFAN